MFLRYYELKSATHQKTPVHNNGRGCTQGMYTRKTRKHTQGKARDGKECKQQQTTDKVRGERKYINKIQRREGKTHGQLGPDKKENRRTRYIHKKHIQL